MSANQNYPYSLPLALEQIDLWPFDLLVKDADGYEVLTQGRYCYSSKDKTVADVMEARSFRADERDQAAYSNAEQVDRLNLIVAAVNAYASNQSEIARLREALERIASTLDVESYPENGSLESQLGRLARAALEPKP